MANLSGNILIITNGEISTAVVDAATARVQGTTQIVDGKGIDLPLLLPCKTSH